MKIKETLFKRHKIYSGKAVNFSVDVVTLPDGKKTTREYLEHPGAVAVLAFTGKDNIVLVSQYRYPIKELTLEVPAGKIDKGETPLKCVRRELKEETGFKAKKIVKLVSFWPTPAFSNEVLHVYAAYGLTQSQKSPDDDEFIETSVMPFKKALEKVMNGNIKDSKTIIAILHHAVTGHHRNKPPNF